jgi:hypothetical protein
MPTPLIAFALLLPSALLKWSKSLIVLFQGDGITVMAVV